MNKAGIYHHCGDSWCYALDENTLHIRIRTAKNNSDRVDIVFGDPFEWVETGSNHRWKSEIQAMTKCGTNGVHDFWEIRVRPPFKRLKYWFIIHKGKESMEFGEKGLIQPVEPDNRWNTFIFPYIQKTEVYTAPEWVSNTIWYQIFPERYHNGDVSINPAGTLDWQHGPVTNREFYGGNLKGIIQKLDHIADLGCNGIYLTPIFESPSVHKYDTTDYMKIDPAFGTEEDLRNLVQEAHTRGIKVMLDAVFNHSGVHFAPWQDVLANGEKSKYRNWFVIDSFPLFGLDAKTGKERTDDGDSHETGFKTFAFTTGMPKLNTTNPELREYLLSVAEYWIKACDIDGWRLDVANEVDHDFWRAFRKRVKETKSDAYIVGEIWHHSIDWLRGDQYDAIMNYHFGQAFTNFLLSAPENPDNVSLANRLTTLELSYPLPVIRSGFNLLDSHDTARLVNQLKGDFAAARQAWLFLALLPGSPCFYYGSEFGVDGGHDPDCRRCMPWEEKNQEPGQFEFLKSIIQLRKANTILIQKGNRTWLTDSKRPGIFGLRICESLDTEGLLPPGSNRKLIVIINREKKAVGKKELKRMLLTDEKDEKAFDHIEASGFAWAELN
ncbi:MAG TPA: glycoside hydrolase family 13 protein [Treponemataceae bacterium]|nr:glycoside hydrolase family 13 protein [Treponemataceae bacterium]